MRRLALTLTAGAALAVAGLAGLAAIAYRAHGHVGTAAAALCFAIAFAAGTRRFGGS